MKWKFGNERTSTLRGSKGTHRVFAASRVLGGKPLIGLPPRESADRVLSIVPQSSELRRPTSIHQPSPNF
ncbi:MAG: hypothetical protein N2049_03630, partial [Anaerolineales bacterium]|nr:hypothetical protein [Anaerolineales bacterium]